MNDNEPRQLTAHGDMASCATETCPSWLKCWRAQKPATSYQPFSLFTPIGHSCDNFIGIKP